MAQKQTLDLFGYARVEHGGRLVRGITARCGYCPTVQSLPVNTFSGNREDCDLGEVRYITRKLEGMGWKVGNNASQHRCPKCFIAIKASSARKRDEQMSQPPKVVSLIEPTRVMSREERRIIFEKLNDVYINDKEGYDKNWSDERVAKDLGVPRAWVALIRDENFGEENTSESTRQLLTEANAVLANVKIAATAVEAAIDEFRKQIGIADKLSKSVAEIERSLDK